jgi:hypothetical protein
MSQLALPEEYRLPLKLHVQNTGLTEEQFVRFCQENPDLRIGLTAQGELVIMAPTGMETGRRNSRLTRRLDTWAEMDGTGITFGSSTPLHPPERGHAVAGWLLGAAGAMGGTPSGATTRGWAALSRLRCRITLTE